MPYKNLVIGNTTPALQNVVQRSQFYRGFSSVNANAVDTRLYDFDLVKQDIINQFNTKKGERLMNPNFGSIIWNLLMEPMTDAVRTALSEDINRICNSDPRVIPTQINMREYESGYLLELTLTLNGTDQSANLRLTFDQSVGLVVG
jgi:phage baseplate assembly protein W